MITVKPKWSPQGAAQFLSLVASGFYENIAIFRVLPGFVAQFGINGNPKIQKAYGSSIPDDPPAHVSNALGTLSFAAHGPNTRSTQVFFNTMDNARLDAMNFQPFAVVEKKGLPIITSFFGGYGETVNQGRIFQEGNSYLKMNFPKLDYIIRMTVKDLAT
jgi:cyclophilin family peptidyl-prolyl cis-trans isomerase